MPDIESKEEDEETYPFGPFFGFFMLGMHLAEAIDAFKKWIRGKIKRDEEKSKMNLSIEKMEMLFMNARIGEIREGEFDVIGNDGELYSFRFSELAVWKSKKGEDNE